MQRSTPRSTLYTGGWREQSSTIAALRPIWENLLQLTLPSRMSDLTSFTTVMSWRCTPLRRSGAPGQIASRRTRGRDRDGQVRQHFSARVGEREAVRSEALGGGHELVEAAEALGDLGAVALELEVDGLHRLGEAEHGLAVEPGEDAHERVKVLEQAQLVRDVDELFENPRAPLELALDEHHRRDPVGEVLFAVDEFHAIKRQARAKQDWLTLTRLIDCMTLLLSSRRSARGFFGSRGARTCRIRSRGCQTKQVSDV